MLGQYTTRLHSVIKTVVVLIMIYILYNMYMNHTKIERFTTSVLMGRSANVTSEYLNQVLYRIKRPLDVIKQANKIEPKKLWVGLSNLKNIIGMKCVNATTVIMIDAMQGPYMAYIIDGTDHERLSAIFKIDNTNRKIVKFVLGESPISNSKSMYSMGEDGRVFRKDTVDVGSNRFKFVDDSATNLTKQVNTNTNKAIDFAYTKHNNAVVILERDGFLSEYIYNSSSNNYTRALLTPKGFFRMLNVIGNRQGIKTGNDSIKYMGIAVKCSGGSTDNTNHICYGPSASFTYSLYYFKEGDNNVNYISSSVSLFIELINKFGKNGQYYQMDMHEYDDMYRLFVTFTSINKTYIVELNKSKSVTDVIKIPNVDKFNLTSHGKYIFTKTSDVTSGVPWSTSTLTNGNKLLFMYPSDQHNELGGNRRFNYTRVNASDIGATGSKKFGVFQVDFMSTSESGHIQLFDMYNNNNLMLLTNTAIH